MIQIIRLIDHAKAAVISLVSAAIGSFENMFQFEIANLTNQPVSTHPLQDLAWFVAIIAGIVSIVNGIDKFIRNRKQKVVNRKNRDD